MYVGHSVNQCMNKKFLETYDLTKGADNTHRQFYVMQMMINDDKDLQYYKDLYELPADVSRIEPWIPYWGAEKDTLFETKLVADCVNNDYGFGNLLSAEEKEK